MPRGYRFLIALAWVGLAFCCGGLGVYVTALNYPREAGYNSYRYAPGDVESAKSALLKHFQPIEYRQPCKNLEGQDEADLCAQWKAARAAELSALWAERTFWLGTISLIITGLGTAFLLRTIKQGELGLERARSANEIARETLINEKRAWIKVSEPRDGMGKTPDDKGFSIAQMVIDMENIGTTVAKRVGVVGILSNVPDIPLDEVHKILSTFDRNYYFEKGFFWPEGQQKNINVEIMNIDKQKFFGKTTASFNGKSTKVLDIFILVIRYWTIFDSFADAPRLLVIPYHCQSRPHPTITGGSLIEYLPDWQVGPIFT